MGIRKKDSVWLYWMMDEMITEGKVMFISRRKDGSIGVSLAESYVKKRKQFGTRKAEGQSLKEAMRKLYNDRIQLP